MTKCRLDKILEGCQELLGSEQALVPAVLVGGPGHRARAIIFLFTEWRSHPEYVAKVAFSEKESKYLIREFEVLELVFATLPATVTRRIPRPLARMEIEGETVIVTKALRGRRFIVPRLIGKRDVMGVRALRFFFQQAFGFSLDMGSTAPTVGSSPAVMLSDVVEEFLDLFGRGGDVGKELLSFRREVDTARIEGRPTRQHCDLMMSNVIENGQELLFVDWEHSRADSHPWFDIAYAPVALALMAAWQTERRLEAVMMGVLNADSWTGRVLSSEMYRVWEFSFPLPWAVLLTAMETANRQHADGRSAANDWSEFILQVLSKAGKRRLSWLSNW